VAREKKKNVKKKNTHNRANKGGRFVELFWGDLERGLGFSQGVEPGGRQFQPSQGKEKRKVESNLWLRDWEAGTAPKKGKTGFDGEASYMEGREKKKNTGLETDRRRSITVRFWGQQQQGRKQQGEPKKKHVLGRASARVEKVLKKNGVIDSELDLHDEPQCLWGQAKFTANAGDRGLQFFCKKGNNPRKMGRGRSETVGAKKKQPGNTHGRGSHGGHGSVLASGGSRLTKKKTRGGRETRKEKIKCPDS